MFFGQLNAPLSDQDQLRAVMLERGLIDESDVRSTILAKFTKWAQANGITEATYGTRWDDQALAVLIAGKGKDPIDWGKILKVAVPIGVGVVGLVLVVKLMK